jgi:hypothetical protein
METHALAIDGEEFRKENAKSQGASLWKLFIQWTDFLAATL